MKEKMTLLSRKYNLALRKHISKEFQGGLRQASEIGHEAVALGLEILALAKIHESTMGPLLLRSDSKRARNLLMSRAQLFFIEAITPIERTHLAAKSAQFQLQQLTST